MGKDKASINPAQAQRKLEKQRALKKGKAEVAARRTERLAHRNPDRLVRQIEELKSSEASGQALKPRDKRILEGLEKDVRAVQKAREALGDRAPQFTRSTKAGRKWGTHNSNGSLGKRKREGSWRSSESETDDEVRRIPMPRDTPPPLPPRLARQGQKENPNLISPKGSKELPKSLHPETESSKNVPQATTRTVYEAAPAVRDLRKDAINAFVPSAVLKKVQQSRGQGRLLEITELDNLHREGYGGAARPKRESGDPFVEDEVSVQDTVGVAAIDEEGNLFENDIRSVELEASSHGKL